MANSVESLTKDPKDILLKTKQELKNKDDYIKKQKTVQDLTKKEYQKLYEEYTSVKKKLQQYDAYLNSLLNEFKKLKKLNMLNEIKNKNKNITENTMNLKKRRRKKKRTNLLKKEKKEKKLAY